jgi:hypothetical protein
MKCSRANTRTFTERDYLIPIAPILGEANGRNEIQECSQSKRIWLGIFSLIPGAFLYIPVGVLNETRSFYCPGRRREGVLLGLDYGCKPAAASIWKNWRRDR